MVCGLNTRSLFLPHIQSPIDHRRYEFPKILGILFSKVPNLADYTAASRTFHAFDQRGCSAVFDDEIDSDAVGELEDLFVPVLIRGIIQRQQWRVWKLVLHLLELLVARRTQDDAET